MGQAGLLGVTLPEDYGAANASYVAYGLVARAKWSALIPDIVP